MQFHLIQIHLWEADWRAPSSGEQHHGEHKRRELEEGSQTRAGFEESTQINIGIVGLEREAGRYSTWHMAWIKRLKYLNLYADSPQCSLYLSIHPVCGWVSNVETRRPIAHLNRFMLKPTHLSCITSSAFVVYRHVTKMGKVFYIYI